MSLLFLFRSCQIKLFGIEIICSICFRKLKKEVQELKQKSALKPGDDADRICVRCRSELGLILNTGAECFKCHFMVCKNCRVVVTEDGLTWLCILCAKQALVPPIHKLHKSYPPISIDLFLIFQDPSLAKKILLLFELWWRPINNFEPSFY